ncbi:MAG: hypothetical protein ACFE0J_07225 [Elainellaceae cyanobacterium]
MQQLANKSRYWFVPRKELFAPRGIDNYEGVALRGADSPIDHNLDQIVENGNSFTILLKSFYVTEKRDEGDNDLLVRSWTKYGSDPPVEVAHFFRKNVPVPYFCKHDVIAEHVFTLQEHLDENLVWVKLQILEIDGKRVKTLEQIVEDSLPDIVDTVGAVFPKALPFMSSITDQAFELFSSLKELVKNKDDVIFEKSLDFCSIDSGETPFRYGVYIFLEDEIEGDRYKLREYRLEPSSSAKESQIPEYVVIEVVPEVTNPFKGDDVLINQYLATGLSAPDDESQNPSQRDKRFQYLQRLIKKARQFDDLLEYLELKRIQNSNTSLTEHQEQRLQQLLIELSDYIKSLDEILDR